MTSDTFYTTAIRYLAGELDEASRDAFERLIQENADLHHQFNNIRIDTYLAGELSEPGLSAFEVQLREDTDLRRSVGLHQKIRNSLKVSETEQFKNELRLLYPEIPPEELHHVHTRSWRRYLAIAAGILVLVFAGWNIWFSDTDPTRLYARHFEPYPMLIGERGEASTMESAKQHYIDGNYAVAATQFKQAADDPLARFYAGVAYLAADEPEMSISILEGLTEDFNFGDQARWYLSLGFLKQQDLDAAERTLILIAEDNTSAYQEKALQLLRKLKK